MVACSTTPSSISFKLSVLALSSRFDGPVSARLVSARLLLSVLALSSRFDGPRLVFSLGCLSGSFSTRSVESF